MEWKMPLEHSKSKLVKYSGISRDLRYFFCTKISGTTYFLRPQARYQVTANKSRLGELILLFIIYSSLFDCFKLFLFITLHHDIAGCNYYLSIKHSMRESCRSSILVCWMLGDFLRRHNAVSSEDKSKTAWLWLSVIRHR